MLPETSFHELGKQLMFVVVNNTIYHANNSKDSENFIFSHGLKFPLKKSESIINIEDRYLKRHADALKNFQRKYAANINSNGTIIENIEAEFTRNKNLQFFISEVIPAYIGETTGKTIQHSDSEIISKQRILETLLRENVAIINKRIYPLVEIVNLSNIRLNNKNYCFKQSEKTMDILEQEFQYHLKERLKKEILIKINQSNQIKQKLSNLNPEARDLAAKGHIKIIGGCYEYGDIGYDSKHQKIYYYLSPHYNKTIKKNYKKRQAVVSVNITDKGIVTNLAVMSRKNPNSDFQIDKSKSFCIGVNCKGTTTRNIVGYLIRASKNITKYKACHE